MALTDTVTAYSGQETTKTALVSNQLRQKTAIGSTPSSISTITAVEYGDGADITTVLTLTNFVVGTIPSANAALGVGNIVYSYPTSDQHFELVSSFWGLALTLPGAGVACDTGLGSVIASGAVSTLDGTATFEDRKTGVAITTAAAGGTAVNSGPVATTAGIGTGIALNGTSSVKNVFLNAAGTFATVNAGSLTATGQIFLKWTRMSS